MLPPLAVRQGSTSCCGTAAATTLRCVPSSSCSGVAAATTLRCVPSSVFSPLCCHAVPFLRGFRLPSLCCHRGCYRGAGQRSRSVPIATKGEKDATEHTALRAVAPVTFSKPLLNNVLRPCTAPELISLLGTLGGLPIFTACLTLPVPRWSVGGAAASEQEPEHVAPPPDGIVHFATSAVSVGGAAASEQEPKHVAAEEDAAAAAGAAGDARVHRGDKELPARHAAHPCRVAAPPTANCRGRHQAGALQSALQLATAEAVIKQVRCSLRCNLPLPRPSSSRCAAIHSLRCNLSLPRTSSRRCLL